MKTNLDSYKTDKKLETDGIWMNLNDKTGFLVTRFGGANSHKIKTKIAKYFKPYAFAIEKGTMDPEKEREINTRVFVEIAVLDWRGVEIDGVDAPFSTEACVKLFLEVPDLADTILKYSSDSSNYREDLGNS